MNEYWDFLVIPLVLVAVFVGRWSKKDELKSENDNLKVALKIKDATIDILKRAIEGRDKNFDALHKVCKEQGDALIKADQVIQLQQKVLNSQTQNVILPLTPKEKKDLN